MNSRYLLHQTLVADASDAELGVLALLVAAQEIEADEYSQCLKLLLGVDTYELHDLTKSVASLPFVRVYSGSTIRVDREAIRELHKRFTDSAYPLYLSAHELLHKRRVNESRAGGLQHRLQLVPKLAGHRIVLDQDVYSTAVDYIGEYWRGNLTSCRAIANAVRSYATAGIEDPVYKVRYVDTLRSALGETLAGLGRLGNFAARLIAPIARAFLVQTPDCQMVYKELLANQSFIDGNWQEAQRYWGLLSNRSSSPYSELACVSLANRSRVQGLTGKPQAAAESFDRAFRMSWLLADATLSFRTQHEFGHLFHLLNRSGHARAAVQQWPKRIERKLSAFSSATGSRFPQSEVDTKGIRVFDDSLEPFMPILIGMTRKRITDEAKAQLADHLADALRGITSAGNEDSRYVYNVLMLCSAISAPEQLFDPLWSVAQSEGPLGVYRGVSLQTCLREAIANNQLDSRLLDSWREIVERRLGSRFPGDPYAGLRCMLRVPSRNISDDEDLLREVGAAMGPFCGYLEPLLHRRNSFRSMVETVRYRFRHIEQLDLHILESAEKNAWPSWAIDALPSPVMHLEGTRFVVWSGIADVLAHFGEVQIEGSHCAERYKRIDVDSSLIGKLRKMGKRYRRISRQLPYFSEDSVFGAFAEVLADFEESSSSDEEAQLWREARESFLRNSLLLPPLVKG